MFGMIANGLADMSDETLRSMIEDEKRKRDTASAALERINGTTGSRDHPPASAIATFAQALRTALASGDLHFKKAWLRALLEQITVGKTSIALVGLTDSLVQAVEHTPQNDDGVRAYEPKWRTRQDSNL
ncbi:MAG: hypothetical protein MUC58_02675 [Rhizobiaceae bacterium]|nr:hypothetical protein [Rhizobiaceae bacterium]